MFIAFRALFLRGVRSVLAGFPTLILCLLFSACGGGGDDTPEQNVPQQRVALAAGEREDLTAPLQDDTRALSYVASYGDLIAVIGADPAAARKHYATWGKAEGRTISFDPGRYIASYGDLISAFGTNYEAGARHYIQYGWREGRATTFEPLSYIASYPDLINAFGADPYAGTLHYIRYGYREGRAVTFDPLRYVASYGDLILAIGLDATGAARHYIIHGFREGRTVTFDPLRYVASYGDLILAIGLDATGAARHYIVHGFREGRTITFDPLRYVAGYPDLVKAYSGDEVAATRHYIIYGYREGRVVKSVYALAGLNFSPYLTGQDPNRGSQLSAAQIRARLQTVSPYTKSVRTFGATSGLEQVPAIATEMGLKMAAGAWISANLAANEAELTNLAAIGAAGTAGTLIVGSEVLLRGDVTEDVLLAYINRIKQAVPNVPVAYADTYSTLLAHPRVMSAVDVVLVNYYPYWEGIGIDDAVASIHGWHMQVVAAAGGKPVIVSETGWPSAGNTIGQAVPSGDNAAKFFLNFVSWARATGTDYYYFEAFDENWKAAYEGPQGAHWGVWDASGLLKPGMQAVFDGTTVPDNWSANSLPGGPGMPTLEFTAVPAYGSRNYLTGRAWHVNPADYKVVVYIFVAGRWWIKPTAAAPLTTIARSGVWTTNITTGGIDEQATRIAAFLVPNKYNPPVLLGATALPAELAQNAAAALDVTRAP